jgi:hypothetical protein
MIKMPNRPTAIEVRSFLRSHKLPWASKVNSSNLDRAIARAMNILITEQKVKPFVKSGKSEWEPYKKEWCKWFEYEELSKSRKEIVMHAMDKEAILHTHIRNDFEYCFVNLYHYQIPMSYHEHRYDRFVASLSTHARRTQTYPDEKMNWQMENDALSIYIVYKVEASILKRGFRRSKPILLEAHTDDPTKFFVRGGNHRLQALRNLMDQGKIKKRFKIPCIISRADSLSVYVSPELEYY